MCVRLALILSSIMAAGIATVTGAEQPALRSAEEILLSYVEDFRADPAAKQSIVFGILVMGTEESAWHVVVNAGDEGSEHAEVELHQGLPDRPAVLYTLDLQTLRGIDGGEINALTAMGRARAADPTPMNIEFMPGFEPGGDFWARLMPLSFHFWTRGFPESVDFGRKYSREIHGAHAVIFYYQKGLRSGWAMVEKGQHVNREPRDQINPFPTMIIGIRNAAMVRIGGENKILQAGQMVFIPAGVAHEAWNPFDEPAEIILLMFGDGA